nr:hypothetical protein [Tanacetum cinerariifolium]
GVVGLYVTMSKIDVVGFDWLNVVIDDVVVIVEAVDSVSQLGNYGVDSVNLVSNPQLATETKFGHSDRELEPNNRTYFMVALKNCFLSSPEIAK